MANFMGPMAPPQAAQPQPPQLDVRTNPAQRAQFKNFMTSMSAPMMPTTAPVAPMLAAPSPMDQIDIFAPVQGMAFGGMVDGGRERGRGDFRDPMQNNFSQASAGPSLGEGGQEMFTDKALAERMFDDSTSFSEILDIDRYLGPASPMFDRQGFSLDVPPAVTDTVSQFTPQSFNSPVGNRISAVATMDNPFGLGGVLSGGPTMDSSGGLGIMANYAIPFRRGGVTIKSGESYETGRGLGEQVRERQIEKSDEDMDQDLQQDIAALAAAQAGVDMSNYFDRNPDAGGNLVNNPLAIANVFEQANQMRSQEDALSRVLQDQFVPPKIEPGDAVVTINPRVEDRSVSIERPSDAQAAIEASRVSFITPSLDRTLTDVSLPGLLEDEITATPFVRPEPGMAGNFGTGAPLGLSSEDFSQDKQQDIAAAAAQNAGIIDGFKFSSGLSPDEMIAARNMSQQMLSIPDELSGQSPFTSGGVPRPSLFSDESVMRQIMDDDTVNRERPTDLKSLFGEDSETYKNIMERATPIQSDTFPTMAGILGKVMGGANINNIINKINEGGVPILDNSGNIQGVVHDGLFGGKVYSGNQAFNPMAGPKPERDDNQPLPLPVTSTTPESETPLTVTPPVVDPTLPVMPPSPTDVIVPSTRTNVPVNVPVIAPAPIESILPQSLLDLLQARQPVARMQEGGAVLDDAAGRFLEALTAA